MHATCFLATTACSGDAPIVEHPSARPKVTCVSCCVHSCNSISSDFSWAAATWATCDFTLEVPSPSCASVYLSHVRTTSYTLIWCAFWHARHHVKCSGTASMCAWRPCALPLPDLRGNQQKAYTVQYASLREAASRCRPACHLSVNKLLHQVEPREAHVLALAALAHVLAIAKKSKACAGDILRTLLFAAFMDLHDCSVVSLRME